MKLNFVVTEWVDNERLVFSTTSGTGVKAYELRCMIEPTPSGSKFTFMENVELPFGVIGKLMGLIGQRSAETHVKEMLVKLKTLVEA